MKILYVPHWLATAVHAQRAPKSVYTNVKALLDIVSLEDVGFYIYLNSRLAKLLPEGITDTFDSWGTDLTDQVLGNDEWFRTLTRSWDDYDMQKRDFSVETAGKQLTCDLGSEHTIVFSHVPRTVDVARAVGHDPQLWLYDRLVRLYKPFISLEGLADTPLFLQYQRALGRSINRTHPPVDPNLDTTKKAA